MPTIIWRAALAALLFAGVARAAEPAGAYAGATRPETVPEYYLDGAETRTELTGFNAPNEGEAKLPPKTAMQYVSWYERGDEPCAFAVGGDWFAAESVYDNDSREVDRCNSGLLTSLDRKGASFSGAHTYVSGVRVCMNRDDDRVKGFDLKGRVVAENGAISAASSTQKEERTNCHHWKRWVECPAGQVAIGMRGEFEDGAAPKSLKGVSLICRRILVRQVAAEDPLVFQGAETVTNVSGAEGTVVTLKPGNGAKGLQYLQWAERRDVPCTLKAEGSDLINATPRVADAVNKCGKTIKEGDASWRSAGFNARLFVTGLSVCVNNGRVKGVELEAKEAVHRRADGTRPTPEDDYNHGEQNNCFSMLEDRSRRWVRCPGGQLAVGVKLHFDRGEEPRALKGIALICRAYDG